MIANIGIIFSILLGSASFIYSWKNSNKTIYINSITSLRTKWLDSLKQDLSAFLGLIRANFFFKFANTKFDEDFVKINQLYYKILLNLNPKDDFDKLVIEKLKEIIEQLEGKITSAEKLNKLEVTIGELITLSQKITKIEWEGIKQESIRSMLNKREKEKLRKKYLD